MRNPILPAILLLPLLVPLAPAWGQDSARGAQAKSPETSTQGGESSTIPAKGGSDLSEDAVGGRGAAMEGSGVEGSKGAAGGVVDGNPNCPGGKSVEARCRN